MADKKISALTAASTPLAGTEVLPIVQSSATVKVATNDLTVRNVRANATTGILQVTGPTAGTTRVATVPDANWTAARTDAAQSFTGDQTLSTGNLIQGTAAKGINFTANTGAAGVTSQLLGWYEEGTWTPTVNGTTTAGTANYLVQNAYYTRVGRQVTANFFVRWDTGTGTGNIQVGGLPFTSKNVSGFYYSGSVSNVSVPFTAGNTVGLFLGHNETKIDLIQISGVTGQTSVPYSAGAIIIGQITYFV